MLCNHSYENYCCSCCCCFKAPLYLLHTHAHTHMTWYVIHNRIFHTIRLLALPCAFTSVRLHQGHSLRKILLKLLLANCAVCVCLYIYIIYLYIYIWVRRWRSWLRNCATSRKVAVSIPDGVIGIFHWLNPSGRIMALGSTQPLTEMSTRNISWGCKAVGA